VDGGERSIIRTGLRHAGKINDKLAYKVSGEYMQGRDWEYNDRAEPTVFPRTANVPASRQGQPNQRDFDLQRLSSEARVDIRPSENTEAITTLGYTKVGSGLELTGANGSTQIKNWTYMNIQQRFRWNRLFAQAFLNNSNAGNDTSTSDKGTYLLRSGQPIVDQSRVAAVQLQHGFDIGRKQSFTYGADYIWTNPRTGGTINGLNETGDNVTEYGAYIQSSTKPTKQLEILLAARGDANNVIEGQFFSPRAALIFKPTENQNVRVTFNRAFSTPANFSFFLDLIQSPNIGGSGFDLIARGNPPKKGCLRLHECGVRVPRCDPGARFTTHAGHRRRAAAGRPSRRRGCAARGWRCHLPRHASADECRIGDARLVHLQRNDAAHRRPDHRHFATRGVVQQHVRGRIQGHRRQPLPF